MSVLKIKDAEGNWVGVTAIKGERGDAGVSPLINVNTNTDSTYKLRIVTEDKEFITPNLKGQGGAGGSGNISSTLGTIDNYKEFEGKNIPVYKSNMPPLQCFEGGTTYKFDHEVTMLVYDGGIDENGNTNIDDYKSYTGTEIFVPTNTTGFLTDYVIYNAAPKQPWDTWENPNIVNMLEYNDPKFFRWFYEREVPTIWKGMYAKLGDVPNLKIDDYSGYYVGCPFDSGDAYITYKTTQLTDSLENVDKKESAFVGVYRAADFPFVLDEPIKFCEYDKKLKEYSEPVEIPYPSVQFDNMKDMYPQFKKGKEHTLQGLYLLCCDEKGETPGVDTLMKLAEEEAEERVTDRCYEMVIASQYEIDSNLHEHKAKPICPAMYIGLAPLKNYTIETLAGDCAIVLSKNDTKYHVTKETTVLYPTTTKTVEVRTDTAQQVGGSAGGGGAIGGTATGPGLGNGVVISYDYIDTTQDPLGKAEIPCALSCPEIYLRKGESYTFQVEDEDEMYGIWVCCWQEEDYAGIKVVEGIEPYSLLMEERMASGATKFNVKTYWTPTFLEVDSNEIMQEFNIKLCDNTTENDYCRFLTNDTIKHFDLDDFTMVGHQHKLSDVSDLQELKDTIPKMVLSLTTLIDGESELPENTFHFVYEE